MLEAEQQLEWQQLPCEPREFRRQLAKAGAALVSFVLDGDPKGRRALARALDAIVLDPRFTQADLAFRVSLLSRCGVAHNWVGVMESDNSELEVAMERLSAGLVLAAPGSPESGRLAINIANTLLNRYQRHGRLEDLQGAEELLRDVLVEAADDEAVHRQATSGVAMVLLTRHRVSGDERVLDEAVRYAGDAVAASRTSPRRPIYVYVLAQVLGRRYDVRGAIEDLNDAIALIEECLASPSLPQQLGRRGLRGELGTLLRRRFLRTHNPADIDEAVRLQMIDVDEDVNPGRLTNLGNALLTRFDVSHAFDDLNQAIALQLRAIEVTPPGDWELASRHNNAGNSLARAFDISGEEHFGKQAEQHYRAAIALTEPAAPERASREYNLGLVLEARCGDATTGAMVDAASDAYRSAIRSGLDGSLEWALASARRWGDWARHREAWSEACEAYSAALDVSRRLFRVQLLREEKETWLSETQGVPAEAAYALVQTKRLDEAVAALESGSALLLSESLDRDRADLDRLAASGSSHLAAGYREAASDLDTAMRSVCGADEVRRRRRRLDEVVEQIRTIEGYGSFLSEPDFEEVVAAVPAGRVLAYIAAGAAGGVGLVVDGAGSVRHAHLPGCSTAAVRRRVEALLAARPRRDDEPQAWHGLLDAVTRWCWEAVVGPVLDLTAPDDGVVLLPAGLLAMLPLHAAWKPTAPSAAERMYAVDLRLVTYAPNARALAVAVRTARETDADPLLIVADPPSPGLPAIGYAEAEAGWVRSRFARVHELPGDKATREAVAAGLTNARVHHIISHGVGNADAPLESALCLAGGERLALRDVLALRLREVGEAPGVRLTVLSACETAQPGTELPDEIVSLPSGLLQAGVAGVVATQWAVHSQAMSLLVARFYQEWRDEGVPPAEALRRAQRWLRDTTNAKKVRDLTQGLPPSGGGPERDLIRSLVLRDPAQRDHANIADWAAASFHGA